MRKITKTCLMFLIMLFVCAFADNAAAMTLAECQKSCKAPSTCIKMQSNVVGDDDYSCVNVDACSKCDKETQNCVQGQCVNKTNAGGTNTTQSASAVTGCSSDYGLFGGLIETGRKIFSGLRDLIYVVAGFGIIGVAVGGFFGNLNWKWLGAIIIALVVIATTGEIINMITGCDQFTQAMITDTLK